MRSECKSKNWSFCFPRTGYFVPMKMIQPMTTSVNHKLGWRAYAGSEERWNAVVQRDSNADGKFYYSVKTTGVYCRPSCAARLPRRENVRFHASCEEAERAGFRACKRCQPNGLTLTEEYAEKVAAACRFIEGAGALPDLGVLAKSAGMSRFHFHRVFKKTTGLTPKDYARAHRAERMRKELSKRNTVTEAIYEAGFNSNGRFYAESSRMLGMKPGKFRQGGTGERIRFAVGECSLGSILVAASEMGVCAIFLGDDANELVGELQKRFAKAQLIGGDKKFERIVARVVAVVEAPKLGLDLPLDVRGTVFQRRVWRALCKIPSGSTASYAEVAKRIGSPKSVRAVASACASNVLAVVIPCHRVLRTGGALSGYRWGVERKRKLLEREKKTET
jgi:AraC family transcriptional regulator of adaptative response/methylated-DNA-[protein]-cysteine methyltransferase